MYLFIIPSRFYSLIVLLWKSIIAFTLHRNNIPRIISDISHEIVISNLILTVKTSLSNMIYATDFNFKPFITILIIIGMLYNILFY